MLKTIPFAAVMAAALINSAVAFPVSQCETRPDRTARTPAETTTISRLSVLQQCRAAIDDRTACNVFLGRALELLFANTDFKTGSGGYMLANDIASGLENTGASMGWSKIGFATEQSSLNNAQATANSGKAVVAARRGRVDAAGVTHPGHVVLIKSRHRAALRLRRYRERTRGCLQVVGGRSGT